MRMALLHEPIFRSESVEGVRRRGPHEAVGFRDRVVDVAEEFHKFTSIMREYADDLNDRFSERSEKYEQGRLTQAEKEKMRSA